MASIHPTAIVASGARIAESAEIGPYCVIGGQVEIGPEVRLVSHVVVDGITSIGEGTVVYPFSSLGHRPQDLKYKGEPSRLVIGKHNQIRENVTMNPGTEGGGMVTSVGDSGLFMVGAHVAHDCQVGNGVIFANNATLGGHVQVGDFVVLGGLSAVHQFVRIGRHVMVGGMSGVENDIIPYATVTGNRAHLSGLNLIGLKRRGYSREDIHALRNAYRLLFAPEGTLAERIEEVSSQFRGVAPVLEILDFMTVDSSRAICQPKSEAAV
ncbi:acyl-ACP--UDP-N-acetylglucosamine O-acyltransferase [Telmatospirillum siberiense]|uniref:Acyl-[acyl-carrier-protein]--UDP-N-acetylglucosamine O-acyltransferase n=1 Tax=Telmatospirillum siberiense TaxID=382514 RepID=A0A2N3PZF2_9PROT|nr:acyl-ACP--UDP-N-acetylglucosamine O-acyltransferase [Telmatospirillum siberiense]PKU25786.1 acyl-[acyl-carrier-protein]--UDP-N-acetylglucosamine O-acyltransferase [Telmatospirillum siberiense]